jgi:hypothetical protein
LQADLEFHFASLLSSVLLRRLTLSTLLFRTLAALDVGFADDTRTDVIEISRRKQRSAESPAAMIVAPVFRARRNEFLLFTFARGFADEKFYFLQRFINIESRRVANIF